MGYSNVVSTLNTYTPGANVLIDDSLVESSATKNVYVKIKEIRLQSQIEPSSLFRFIFDLRCPTETGYGRIYRNGVAVGTEQTVVATGANYTNFSEDIVMTNWTNGDLVQLYGKWNGFAPVEAVYVRNFQICGTPSEWVII